MSCCAQLLYDFKSFQVTLPKKTSLSNNAANLKKNLKNTTNNVDYDEEKISLKLHIGLSLAPTHHIILGVDNDTQARLEYFISGPSVKESGDLLAQAPSGQFYISEKCWNCFVDCASSKFGANDEWNFKNDSNLTEKNSYLNAKSIVNKGKIIVPVDFNILKTIGAAKQKLRVISENDSELYNFIYMLQKKLPDLDKAIDSSHTQKIKRIFPFIEESLANTIKLSLFQTKTFDTRAGLNDENIRSFNQVRNIVSVFVLLKSLKIPQFDEDQNLENASKGFQDILAITKAYGGCCRQFGCDDKLTSALLVWGMDGFSHEKGDVPFAVEAALEMAAKLEVLFGSEYAIGIATGSAYVSNYLIVEKTIC